ncbi:cytochrome d ubiquinol oxidase subunit II [Epidermidibacterium keratini]|uniref:Cytochrome d ubiquinol oxidase subunit II n=1 Tax=Epidermidibacterium keratini TaxID=1891644 RepID=A0A7L4YLV2_9ACTN|nr:cytochrome d ubiquinol oxidase subunit II [Epidermidibacterium keratini]QHC00251.1 cytochrome d ubiquinol oxidase subunit II [Epidermidibacterium keratini]
MIADIWFGLIAFSLMMYVVLDGYDLGIGIASLFERNRERRTEKVEIVATAWDGNESWIILMAVALWGGLPEAFGALLPAIYLPIIVMLFGIILRGAAIELSVSLRSDAWITVFGIGSLIVAIAQGFAIGGVLQGISHDDGVFNGGTWDFLSWYSVLTAVATVAVYVVAGAAFGQLKSEGESARAARRLGLSTLLVGIPIVAVTAIWSMDLLPQQLTGGRVVLFWALVVVAVIATAATIWGFRSGPDAAAMVGVVVAEISGMLALVVGMVPIVVPPDMTISEAAAPHSALTFLLVGIGLNVPLVLFYNWYAHHVFRGKYRPVEERPAGVTQAGWAMRAGGERASDEQEVRS